MEIRFEKVHLTEGLRLCCDFNFIIKLNDRKRLYNCSVILRLNVTIVLRRTFKALLKTIGDGFSTVVFCRQMSLPVERECAELRLLHAELMLDILAVHATEIHRATREARKRPSVLRVRPSVRVWCRAAQPCSFLDCVKEFPYMLLLFFGIFKDALRVTKDHWRPGNA